MRLLWLCAIVLWVSRTLAIHASEAGVVDWHKPLVGVPLLVASTPSFHKVGGAKSRSLVLTATFGNILAALDPIDGSIGVCVLRRVNCRPHRVQRGGTSSAPTSVSSVTSNEATVSFLCVKSFRYSRRNSCRRRLGHRRCDSTPVGTEHRRPSGRATLAQARVWPPVRTGDTGNDDCL